MAPTPTSNRVCTDTPCDNLHYHPREVFPRSSNNCRPVADCPKGTFESVPPTKFDNRQCKTIGTCDRISNQLEFEREAPTATSDRACAPCSTCPRGMRATGTCTATSDTPCNKCPTCGLGRYTLVSCTDTTFSQCKQCNACSVGFFQGGPVLGSEEAGCDGYHDTKCTRCSACIEGEEYTASECTRESDVVCKVYSDACIPGVEYEASAATATSDRVCIPITNCSLAATDMYETVAPTDTSDRECADRTVCYDNSFYSETTPCSDGDSEYEVDAGGPSRDRQCTCPALCDAGDYQKTAPTPTSDRVCEACPSSYFTSGMNTFSFCDLATECDDGTEFEEAPYAPWQVRRLSPPISPIFLTYFRLYEVVSLHTCVLPYKYRKILEMLLKFMK